jgi:drug/metabolite transporter (DMT)-like permease
VIIVSTLIVLPLRILALGKNYVGENVQPRYFLPLLFLLVGVAVFSPKGVTSFYLSEVQISFVALLISAGQSFALHFAMRRYITGSDVVSWNLNKNIEWWWAFLPSPMTSWAIGSLGFAIAVSIGLWHLRKPVKSDY